MSRFLSRLSVVLWESQKHLRGCMIQAVHKQTGWLAGLRECSSGPRKHAPHNTQMYMHYKRSGKKPNELSVSKAFFFFFVVRVLMILLELVRTHPPHADTHKPLNIKAFFCQKSTTNYPKSRRQQEAALGFDAAGRDADEAVTTCPLVTGIQSLHREVVL